MDEARFTMRIHPIIMNKMKYIAKHNGRSLNKEIEQILKWIVDDYERKCGKIELSELDIPNKKTEPAAISVNDPMDMLFKLEKNTTSEK